MAEYFYEINALPMLRFGEEPSVTLEEFTALCDGQLSPDIAASLDRVSLEPDGQPSCEVERQWQAWETYLRNQLVALRAFRYSLDASSWLRPDLDAFPTERRQVEEIMANPDPRGRERELDRFRWQRLDDLGVGHTFDLAALVLYKLKLLLALRWCSLSVEESRTRHEHLVAKGVENAGAARASSEEQAREGDRSTN